MNKQEVTDFEEQPHLQEIVDVRRWDDLAKDPTRQTPPFSFYKSRLAAVVTA